MTILLRTLSRKSIVGIGQLKTLTVADAFALEYQAKLIAAYYCNNTISFSDDILEDLGITGEYRIAKPGKCPEKREIATKHFYSLQKPMTDLERIKKWSVKHSFRKRAVKQDLRHDKKKSQLQFKNQGHK